MYTRVTLLGSLGKDLGEGKEGKARKGRGEGAVLLAHVLCYIPQV